MKFTVASAMPSVFFVACSIRFAQFAQSTSIGYVFFMINLLKIFLARQRRSGRNEYWNDSMLA